MIKKIITTGLVGIVLSTPSYAIKKEHQKNYPYKIKKIIKNYLYNLYGGEGGYVDFMSKYSKTIRKNVEKLGKKEVVRGYVNIHLKSFDLSLEEKNFNTSLKKTLDELIEYQKTKSSNTYIDYSHPAVREGYKSLVLARKEFYKKIIQKNRKKRFRNYINLIHNAFTKKQFYKESEKKRKARKKIYDGFSKSFENFHSPIPGFAFLVRTFGPFFVNRIREKSDEFHNKEEKRLYP